MTSRHANMHINSAWLRSDARILDLSQPVYNGAPFIPGSQPAFQMSLWNSAANTRRVLDFRGVSNGIGVNVEVSHMTFHVGTHIDALGHITCCDKMHGGREEREVVGVLGLRTLDAAEIPCMISRAILLNCADLDGTEYLQGGRVIGRSDLELIAARDDVKIRDGDVAIVHTGWGRFYGDQKSSYAESCPGLDVEAAKFLTDCGVVAIGADTMAVEVMPGVDPSVVMPVHIHTLVEKGIYLIENLYTKDLATAGVTEFEFIMIPLNIKGATASLVRPLALLSSGTGI